MAHMYNNLHTFIAFCKHIFYFVLNLFIFVFVFSNISLNYQICIHIGRCTPKKSYFSHNEILKIIGLKIFTSWLQVMVV